MDSPAPRQPANDLSEEDRSMSQPTTPLLYAPRLRAPRRLAPLRALVIGLTFMLAAFAVRFYADRESPPGCWVSAPGEVTCTDTATMIRIAHGLSELEIDPAVLGED